MSQCCQAERYSISILGDDHRLIRINFESTVSLTKVDKNTYISNISVVSFAKVGSISRVFNVIFRLKSEIRCENKENVRNSKA